MWPLPTDCRSNHNRVRCPRARPVSIRPEGFRYLLDPVFLGSAILYAFARVVEFDGASCVSGFWDGYFADLFLVPVALPPLLYISRLFGLRKTCLPPTIIEVAIPLTIWSVAFEFLGPMVFPAATADAYDIVAYTFGAIVSWLLWNRNTTFAGSLRAPYQSSHS